MAVAMVACVPDWPWYNRNGLQWLPSAQQQEDGCMQQSAARQKKAR